MDVPRLVQILLEVIHVPVTLAIVWQVIDELVLVSGFTLTGLPWLMACKCLQTDINECADGTHGCAQMCTNQIGGYSCSCGSGYQLASDRRGCVDINECTEGTDNCGQTCTNTIGSYRCSCGTGYRLASDRQACIGKS